MADDTADPTSGVRLPARTIPHPASISPLARAALAAGAARPPSVAPPLDDLAGWRARIAQVNARADPIIDAILASSRLEVTADRIAGVPVHVARRTDLDEAGRALVNLHLHGGAWTYFGGRAAILPAAVTALQYGGTVYAVDYRTAPDHPYPAGLEDCLAVYRVLSARYPRGKLLLSGDSAGANLAAATLMRARAEGLPFPGALFLNTPVADMSGAGDTIETNRGLDLVLSEGLGDEYALYRGSTDPRDPGLSPIHGDFAGFPPTYIRTGTRDILLSDSVRMHAALRKAGVAADLYVGEAMPHGGFAMLGEDTPEDIDARADLIRWLARHWG